MTALRAFLTTTLLLGLTLAGKTGYAQAPTGSITNQVDGVTNALWDAGLLFPDLTQDAWTDLSAFGARATNDAVRVSFSAPQTLDGHGALRGSGTNSFSLALVAMNESFYTNQVAQVITNEDGSTTTTNVDQVSTNWAWADVTNYDGLPGNYTVHGSVTGIKGAALIRFYAQESGQATLDGVTHRVATTRAFYLTIPTGGFLMSGSDASIIRLSGEPRYEKGGRYSQFNPFYTYLGGGSWTLVLNFDEPTGTAINRLSGTATATLSSGNVYPFHFTGRYSPKTDLSNLLLTGVKGTSDTKDGRGCTLAVTVATNQVVKMLGRVAGQAISQK